MGSHESEKHFDVSRETMEELSFIVSELTRWNKKINLVSPTTLSQAWDRHIIDSAQLHTHIPDAASAIADLGSGGGFPALVLAILSKASHANRQFTLIESDTRKCAFLRHVSRETNLNTRVITKRIEDVRDETFDVITARALAPLDKLLAFSKPLARTTTHCLFLKGQDYQKEISSAETNWEFQVDKIQSMTNSDSAILHIRNFRRA